MPKLRGPCFSIPLRNRAGRVLGTIATYFDEPHHPRLQRGDDFGSLVVWGFSGASRPSKFNRYIVPAP